MQHDPEKKTNAVGQFLKEKGYYIVLALCVAAVGVSGYLFVRAAVDSHQSGDIRQQATLSVPVRPAAPVEKLPQPETSDVLGDAAEHVPAPVPQPKPEPEPVKTVKTVRPLPGEVVAAFSADELVYNGTTRDWRTHEGVDLAAAVGDPVAASRDGTVSAVVEDTALGNTVILSHDGGYTTRYANLAEEAVVTAGQTVRAGDVIGAVGETAMTELNQPSHLHFAVYQDGVPVDPETFFSGS